MNSGRDQMPPVTKFVAPTVTNGTVYIPVGSNDVTVYGMLSDSGAESATPSITPATVGIFSADCSGTGQANVQNQDGTPNSPDNPAEPGSVVTLWATGAGQPSPSGAEGASVTAVSLPRAALPVRAQIGEQAA